MPFTVTMPKLSPTMETGTIAKWHKKEGEHVAAGDVLLEVSTDKATVEHTALDEGWLRKLLVNEGQDAEVNQPIAIFTEEKGENIEGYSPEGVKSAEPLKQQAAKPAEKKEEAISVTNAKEKRVVASPLAKKVAEMRGIDLTTVEGSGPRNRIVIRDLEEIKPKAKREFAPAEPMGSFEEVPLSKVRRVIAERLQEAKATIPHFYVEKTINAEPLVHLKDQLASHGVKVSINDCVVRATALAIREYPGVNVGFNAQKETLLQFKTIDISVAVNVEDGLITPIIRYADKKSLAEISAEIRALAKKAKEGKLQPIEFQGGSFTVSNLGMYGVTNFQAIINPPQGAILAVSGIQDVPVVKDGAIVPGKVMHLNVSCDHRVIDGVKAAEFLKVLQKYLESPLALLLD